MPEDAARNLTKQKLSARDLVLCLNLRLTRSVDIAMVAKAGGYDALYVDMQHAPYSIETTATLCAAALGIGVTPLVRVPSHDAQWMSRVLDGGAQGAVRRGGFHAPENDRSNDNGENHGDTDGPLQDAGAVTAEPIHAGFGGHNELILLQGVTGLSIHGVLISFSIDLPNRADMQAGSFREAGTTTATSLVYQGTGIRGQEPMC